MNFRTQCNSAHAVTRQLHRYAGLGWHLLHKLGILPQLLSSQLPVRRRELVGTLLGADCTEVEGHSRLQKPPHLCIGRWQHSAPQHVPAEGLREMEPILHCEVAAVLHDAPALKPVLMMAL